MSTASQPSSTVLHQDFEAWANVFLRQGAVNHPSELHGNLSGQLALGARLSNDAWLALAAEHMGSEQVQAQQEEDAELRDFLMDAYEQTLQAMYAPDMSFAPLLPDDEYDLNERLMALSAWVRGFLEGMALVGSRQLGESSPEIRELIRDFVAISQVDAQEDGSEEDEQQLTEVVEFVRVGVLTVFTEFNTAPAAETLH